MRPSVCVLVHRTWFVLRRQFAMRRVRTRRSMYKQCLVSVRQLLQKILRIVQWVSKLHRKQLLFSPHHILLNKAAAALYRLCFNDFTSFIIRIIFRNIISTSVYRYVHEQCWLFLDESGLQVVSPFMAYCSLFPVTTPWHLVRSNIAIFFW